MIKLRALQVLGFQHPVEINNNNDKFLISHFNIMVLRNDRIILFNDGIKSYVYALLNGRIMTHVHVPPDFLHDIVYHFLISLSQAHDKNHLYCLVFNIVYYDDDLILNYHFDLYIGYYL